MYHDIKVEAEDDYEIPNNNFNFKDPVQMPFPKHGTGVLDIMHPKVEKGTEIAKDCNKKVRGGKYNRHQVIELLSCLQSHPELALSRFTGPPGTLNHKWDEIAERLNEFGPSKTGKQWRKAWRELKWKTRARYTDTKNVPRASDTVKNPPSLTDLEIKILELIGPNSTEDEENLDESRVVELLSPDRVALQEREEEVGRFGKLESPQTERDDLHARLMQNGGQGEAGSVDSGSTEAAPGNVTTPVKPGKRKAEENINTDPPNHLHDSEPSTSGGTLGKKPRMNLQSETPGPPMIPIDLMSCQVPPMSASKRRRRRTEIEALTEAAKIFQDIERAKQTEISEVAKAINRLGDIQMEFQKQQLSMQHQFQKQFLSLMENIVEKLSK